MYIPAKPWTSNIPPKRVLAIRLQAMGDLVITLPYLQALRHTLPPGTKIDLLTRKEVASIPQNIYLFDRVYAVGGGRNAKKILLYTVLLMPRLLSRRYNMVIDLQHNSISELVLQSIRPAAWSVFDRFSPVPAGERTRLTIEAAGVGPICMNNRFRLKDANRGRDILKRAGWNETDSLVVLNPAGFVATRNWPIPNYIQFAQLWFKRFPATRFVVLGIAQMEEKAALLKQALGNRLFNLVNQTTPLDAFAVLQLASFVLSEDSGLMHMSWISGIPTMALFGSTKGAMAGPLGSHSFYLDSADLPCGNCMQSVCKWGDTRCLTRYTPGMVAEHAFALMDKHKITNTVN